MTLLHQPRDTTVDPETLQKRIDERRVRIDSEPDPAKRLELIQKRIDDEERLANLGEEVDIEGLQKAFVEAAKEYSERKGITYSAWREAGVPAAMLKKAGIPRTRRSSNT